ncbi:hypothetical protein [Sphingomonas sp. CV7422]|uniref:hypothetical protein n=1 Tax=Sphingomonas sp. CV7422 TaxID=3018036 RepID=UPI0022FF371D|nr:hypothetical protein [Sphingomonas sp. CV7422]
MSELANESFKRQLELDESVWRSLPFFAATFAFIAAMAGRAATDTPKIAGSFIPVVSHIFLILAIGSLAWALRWFVPILRKREYEYPSSDEEVKRFAEEMNEYHSALGLEGDDLDAKVVEELRLFMIDQHGSAARTNFVLNGTRMAARSKALLFMLTGFVLAFLCEATIFVYKDFSGPAEVQNGAEERQVGSQEQRNGAVRAGAPNSAEVPDGDRGRELLGNEIQAAKGTREVEMVKRPTQRPTGTVQAPTRPTPPSPQYMAKRGTELGNSVTGRVKQPGGGAPPSSPSGKRED